MVPEQVQAGAVFLDRMYGPEWHERVNLDILDLDSGCHCVAAQVVGGIEGSHSSAYEFAMHLWGITREDGEFTISDNDRARALGFLGEEITHARELEEGWQELIASRISSRELVSA
jgi:hypothetical protein